MYVLSSGFYIDEINNSLGDIISDESFYEIILRHRGFEIDGLPEIIHYDDIPVLLKVCVNILKRGSPTRCPISIAECILDHALGERRLSINLKLPDLVIPVENWMPNQIDASDWHHFFLRFHELDESSASAKAGTVGLQAYRIFSELRRSSHLQLTLVLLLATDMLPNNKIRIKGIRNKLAASVVDDLNTLFTHLNNLSSDDEMKIEILQLCEDNDAFTIGVNVAEGCHVTVKETDEDQKIQPLKLMTDRKVAYKPLGKTLEFEKEGKYEQRFEYANLSIKEGMLYLLRNIFRKTDYRPGQLGIINRALNGKDVIGLLPTGGGKSLTYQLCALLHPGVTVVVDPIISLMRDQYDKLYLNGIKRVAFINSTLDSEERIAAMNDLMQGEYQIIFISPERFQIEQFRQTMLVCAEQKMYFSYAVIDEAHCVSEWGHDFRHTYLKLAQNISRYCKARSGKVTLLGLTATASFDVLADVQRELEVADDALVNLPAEAIDRSELHFEVIRCFQVPTSTDREITEGSNPFDENALIEHLESNCLAYNERERIIGNNKYPIIKRLLDEMPKRLESFESNCVYDFSSKVEFYSRRKGKYANGGVIFCPTKSNKLPNGVIKLERYLKSLKFLDIGTFFAAPDDDSVPDKEILEQAKLSAINQERFLKDESNLMIATKAFGMGIDKPNIRFTIHYALPSSVESFYQEAGRAGRDRSHALCTILYHPNDLHTNMEFFANSFKGVNREKEIMNELLNEVQYEDGQHLKILCAKVAEKFPKVSSIKISSDRYLNIYGKWSNNWDDNVNFGKLDLARNLIGYTDNIQNTDRATAEEIQRHTAEYIKKNCPDGKWLEWLRRRSNPGIQSLMLSAKKSMSLQIGFTNRTFTEICEHLKPENPQINENILRAAYKFSSSPEQFISNLHYQYKLSTSTEISSIDLGVDFINSNYHRIRNVGDTQKAIYRLSILGVIDDYVIDYSARFIEVIFKFKNPKEYTANFRRYLLRYLGPVTAETEIKKIEQRTDESPISRVISVLIEYINLEISDKRKRGIEFMRTLCKNGTPNGDRSFRDEIVFYFTSKYALAKYLPTDTERGRKDHPSTVIKYIEFIFNPPDELGGEVDNAKHLRGACLNFRLSIAREMTNRSVDLLFAFSTFVLHASKVQTLIDALSDVSIKDAVNLFTVSFENYIEREDLEWKEVRNLLLFYVSSASRLNPSIGPILEELSLRFIIDKTTQRMRIINNYISA